MRKIGDFLLANDLNAGIVALICALLPLIYLPGGFLASIIVGFITLQKGSKSGLFVLAWVALPAIALFILRRFEVFDILLVRCFLVFLFALVLRAYRSWCLVLELGVLLGFLVILGLHLFIPDMKAWWTGHMNEYINMVGQSTSWQLSSDETQALIQRMVPFATGMSAGFVLIATFVELLMARWWQSAIFSPGSLRYEFTNIHFGRIPALVLSLITIVLFFKIHLVMDFFPIAIVPFVIAGLSLLHFTVNRNRNLWIPAILLYVGLFFLPIIVVILLSITGYIDSWINVRNKMACRKEV